MVGTADGGIHVSVPRLRAVLKQPLIARIVNYHFRITGPTSTIKADSDGVTRKGVTLWANVVNACNLDFLSCRTDDRVGAGFTVVEAQSQLNPLVTGPMDNAQLNGCAGQGYTAPNKLISTIDIMDGAWHDFSVQRIDGGFKLFFDGVEEFRYLSPLADTYMYGLRTDNVNVDLLVTVL